MGGWTKASRLESGPPILESRKQEGETFSLGGSSTLPDTELLNRSSILSKTDCADK